MEQTDLVGFLDRVIRMNESKRNGNGGSSDGNNSSGSGTSNVTIIAPKMDVNDLKSFVLSEIATARNIKSAQNRKAVGESLRSMQMKLKSLKEIPDTGIAMYAGQYI